MTHSHDRQGPQSVGKPVAREASSSKSFPSQTIVHAKLKMSEPGDSDEREADSVADEIVNHGSVRRQIMGGGSSSGVALPSRMTSVLHSMKGGGNVLPDGVKSRMEAGFRHDFSQVRIHNGIKAAEVSSSINAKAFTYGNDIYFNQGQYNPYSKDGQRLIAHELAHTMQHSGKVARDGGDNYDGPCMTENKFAHNRIDLLYTNTGIKSATPAKYAVKGAIYLDSRIPLFQRLVEAVEKYENSSPTGYLSLLSSKLAGGGGKKERMEELGNISRSFIGVDDDEFKILFQSKFGQNYNPPAINQAAEAASKYATAKAIVSFCEPIIRRTEFERNSVMGRGRINSQKVQYMKSVIFDAVKDMMCVTGSDIAKQLGSNYNFFQINQLYLDICKVVSHYDKIDDSVARAYATDAYGPEYGLLSFEVDSYLTAYSILQYGFNLGVGVAVGLATGGLSLPGQIMAGAGVNMILGDRPDNMSDDEYVMNAVKQGAIGVGLGAVLNAGKFNSLDQSIAGALATSSLPSYKEKGHPFEKADLSTVVDLSTELTEKSNNPAEQLRNRLLIYGMKPTVIGFSESMLKYYKHTDSWIPFSTNGLVTLFERDKMPVLQSGKGDKESDYSFETFILAPEEKKIIIKEIEEVLDL